MQSLRRKSQPSRSAKLGSDAAFDLGAKAALPRIGNRWTTLFEPVDPQNRSFVVGDANRLPINFDATSGNRLRPIFCGVGCKLMERHRQRQHGARAQHNVLAAQENPLLIRHRGARLPDRTSRKSALSQ